ncbi:MAG: hypothetical protein JRC66_06705 [Deltaproteobacteria bacterium]|nr:hypothetical protein [Deltaproteobacteria bacterium]
MKNEEKVLKMLKTDVDEEKKEGEEIHFDDIFCKLKFILESPDMDTCKRSHLLQLVDVLHKELMEKNSFEERCERITADIEEIKRKRSVYFKDSKPVARKEGECSIYNAFNRILV